MDGAPIRYSAWPSGEPGETLHSAQRELENLDEVNVTRPPRVLLVYTKGCQGVTAERVARAGTEGVLDVAVGRGG